MSAWTCPNCEAEVNEGFDACWQCGASKDGAVDPAFVREVDVATLPPGWVSRIRCESCGYTGKALIAHYGYRWWTFPLSLALACTLVGLFPWVVIFLILGNRKYKACPKCNARDGLRDWDGADHKPSRKAEEIWQTRQEADRAAFRKNRLTLLAVTLLALLLSLLYMFAAMDSP